MLGGTRALASDSDYTTGANAVAISTTANCRSALMRDGCNAAAPVPLPAVGAIAGAMLTGALGLLGAVHLRRKRDAA